MSSGQVETPIQQAQNMIINSGYPQRLYVDREFFMQVLESLPAAFRFSKNDGTENIIVLNGIHCIEPRNDITD